MALRMLVQAGPFCGGREKPLLRGGKALGIGARPVVPTVRHIARAASTTVVGATVDHLHFEGGLCLGLGSGEEEA